jgi:hypothetical protein
LKDTSLIVINLKKQIASEIFDSLFNQFFNYQIRSYRATIDCILIETTIDICICGTHNSFLIIYLLGSSKVIISVELKHQQPKKLY